MGRVPLFGVSFCRATQHARTASCLTTLMKVFIYGSTEPEYIKQFSAFMLDIKDITEEDRLFNFMKGLQGPE